MLPAVPRLRIPRLTSWGLVYRPVSEVDIYRNWNSNHGSGLAHDSRELHYSTSQSSRSSLPKAVLHLHLWDRLRACLSRMHFTGIFVSALGKSLSWGNMGGIRNPVSLRSGHGAHDDQRDHGIIHLGRGSKSTSSENCSTYSKNELHPYDNRRLSSALLLFGDLAINEGGANVSVGRQQKRRQTRPAQSAATTIHAYHKRSRRKKQLKIVGIVAVALILVAGIGYLITQGSGGGAKIGGVAPDFTLVDSNGNTFSLSQFRAQPVILFFMTTSDWCQPCKIETKNNLVPLYSTFGSRIQIISIELLPQDRSNTDLNAYKATYQSTWIYARDTAKVGITYGIETLSTAAIVDQSGVVRFIGTDPSYDQMTSTLRDLGV